MEIRKGFFGNFYKMKYLNKISSDALQSVIIPSIDGKNATCVFRFLPTQKRWMIDITYGDFVLNGYYISCSPNFLRKFRNIIPFGMSCITAHGFDPFSVDDFETQTSLLYLLDSDDVQTIESILF